MRIDLNVVPYDSGHRLARMGCGPTALLEGGLAERLERAGHRVAVHMIETTLAFPTENAVAFDLARSVAGRVRHARATGRFPLTLSGNCMSALGVVAGLGPTAVIWFDAHGDFNSPETSRSGFLDGMAGAVLVGWCWGEAAGTVPGFTAVPESSFALVGVRDLDPAEAALLGRSRVTVIDPVQSRNGERLDAFLEGTGSAAGAYVHIDLDVLDPERVGRANSYAAADGLSVDDVTAVIRAVKRCVPVVAAGVAAYDPSCDTDGRVHRAAAEILEELLG